MLACSPALAPLAAIAVQHHERMDGSGYPRGLAGGAVSPGGRLLAAADFYHSRIEPRPHRQASGAYEAAVQLRAEAKACLLDAEGGARCADRRRAPHNPQASQVGRPDGSVRSRFSYCWPRACRTGRSPGGCLSQGRQPAITSSTSTPRRAPRTARLLVCTPPTTASSASQNPNRTACVAVKPTPR